MLNRRLSLSCCLFAALALVAAWLPVSARAESTPTTMWCGNGDDTITLALGDYLVDGGGGTDTLLLPLFPNEYQFAKPVEPVHRKVS